MGIGIPVKPVCRNHRAPIEFVEAWVYQRPPLSLVLGPRGGGKSYLSALATHCDSLRHAGHGTRVLGGSMAQSEQIYNALREFSRGPTGPIFARVTAERAEYLNGSDVSILAATAKSVRGPHIPSLRLDEVDEIDTDIRDSALGMCMARHGCAASVSMTSTWHRVGGPMAELIERAQAGEFPFYPFCVFEVLERCPPARSGPRVEGPDLYRDCPTCPVREFCHAETAPGPDGRPEPKAKRSSGHYAIDSLVQKAMAVSRRVFEADYLCAGPKADGLWFTAFDEAIHVSETAEYRPMLDVHLAVDSGVFTGTVFYQVQEGIDGSPTVYVFADYLSENVPARQVAGELRTLADTLCQGRIDHRWTDPAGGSRNPVGETVISEYEAGGLDLDRWPKASVADGLALIDSFLRPAAGPVRLVIHPRCVPLIRAFRAYRRKKKQGQWMDYPEDPQHPAEDLIDALRGGLYAEFRGPVATYGTDPTGDYRG